MIYSPVALIVARYKLPFCRFQRGKTNHRWHIVIPLFHRYHRRVFNRVQINRRRPSPLLREFLRRDIRKVFFHTNIWSVLSFFSTKIELFKFTKKFVHRSKVGLCFSRHRDCSIRGGIYNRYSNFNRDSSFNYYIYKFVQHRNSTDLWNQTREDLT